MNSKSELSSSRTSSSASSGFTPIWVSYKNEGKQKPQLSHKQSFMVLNHLYHYNNRPEAKSVFSVLTCWLNVLLQISCFQRHLLFGRNYSSRYSGLFGEKVRWSRPTGLNQSNFKHTASPPTPRQAFCLETLERHNWVGGRAGRVSAM